MTAPRELPLPLTPELVLAVLRGEKTRTLARVMVKGGRVWRLLAACPEGAFAALRPDLEKILDSFRVE